MVEQNGFDNAFTTDEYWRLCQLLDEDAIRNLTLCYSHYHKDESERVIRKEWILVHPRPSC